MSFFASRSAQRRALACLLALPALLVPSAARAADSPPLGGALGLVTVSPEGAPANAPTWDSGTMSSDGSLLAFHSDASNLVPGDTNGMSDVFVHELATGETERITGLGGAQVDGYVYNAQLSGNGRWLAFNSNASNIVADDANGTSDTFVLDRSTGETELVSRGPGGAQMTAFTSAEDISSDGRFVTFRTFGDVYIRDRVAGTTRQADVTSTGEPGNGTSQLSQVSDDGRFVAFETDATNLFPGDTNAERDVVVKDLETGEIEVASVNSDEDPRDSAYGGLSLASMTPDGRFLAMSGFEPGLAPGDAGTAYDAFVRDRREGTTVRASITTAGTTNNAYDYPGGRQSLSDDGRYLAFFSYGGFQTEGGFFVRDLETGTTRRAVTARDGGVPDGHGPMTLSGDGRRVAVATTATNLVDGDTNGLSDLFAGAPGGTAPPADTTAPELTGPASKTVEATSPDGAEVSFEATADDARDPDPTVTCDPASGSLFPVGETTVTCTATDAAGNSSSATFRVTVTPPADTEPPTLELPAGLSAPATGPSGAPVTYDATARDDRDATPSVTCEPASGATFPIGETMVTCTATDAAGNESRGTFPVTVTGAEDSDGDGLSDVIEIWLGCDPHEDDTDGDGLNDRIEILLGTNPRAADSDTKDGEGDDLETLTKIYRHRCGCGPDDDEDGDGVATWVELKYGTNPGVAEDEDELGGYRSTIDYIWHACGCKPEDEDGNGVPTMVEKFYGTGDALTIIRRCGCKPWKKRSGGGGIWIDLRLVGGPGGVEEDPDGDGKPTVIEIWLGCNPHAKDTDGDGLDDSREIELGTDPRKRDTDGDGMDDRREIELGCNPLDPDTDDDGRKDGEDNCPLVANADQKDKDGDGKGDACDDTDDRLIPPTAITTTEYGAPCKVTYGGRITTAGGAKATFGGNAQPLADGSGKGQQEFQDHGTRGFTLHGMTVRAIRCKGQRAVIWGDARIGTKPVRFRIDLVDKGEPGTSDTYRILLSDGYDSGEKVIVGGNVQLHKAS